MTNSIIPYVFTAGTKAKASEVNANFSAVAEEITSNKTSADNAINNINNNINNINTTLSTKSDKSTSFVEFPVSDTNTSLDNYKTKGVYTFSSEYAPTNSPKGTSGFLVVAGEANSLVKQIWINNGDSNEVFSREFTNSQWTSWKSSCGYLSLSDTSSVSYLKLPNNIILQWGGATTTTVTYPLAYTKYATPVFMKHGAGSGYSSPDFGFASEGLTGFIIQTYGEFAHMHWFVIGR